MDLSKYEAICFDMDGTLLDTKVDYVKMANVIFDVLEDMGVPSDVIKRDESAKFNIDSGFEWLVANGRQNEVYSVYGKVADISKKVEMEHLHEATLFPGTIEFLDDLKSKGLKIGVLTRGCREYAEAVLKFCGIYDKLDEMVARDDYPEPEAKPSPKAMKNMANRIGVPSDKILFLGDHKFDYDCAKNAGTDFVGVLSGTYSQDDWNSIDSNLKIINTIVDLTK